MPLIKVNLYLLASTISRDEQFLKMFHICSKCFLFKLSEIFAHARTKSFSVHGLDIRVEWVIVDQLEIEATVTTPSSTFRKLKPENNRHFRNSNSKINFFKKFLAESCPWVRICLSKCQLVSSKRIFQNLKSFCPQ